ncbi:hypothetical protein FALCPG4_011060 [Fusarium falciforme]
MSTDVEKDDPKRKQNDPLVNKYLLHVRVNSQAQADRDRSQYQEDQKLWLLASFGDIIDTDDNNNNNHSSRNIRTDLQPTPLRILSDSFKKETRRDPSSTATTELSTVHIAHLPQTQTVMTGSGGPIGLGTSGTDSLLVRDKCTLLVCRNC